MTNISPKNLKIGDEFYEFAYGFNMHLVVTSHVKENTVIIDGKERTQYSWFARNVDTDHEVEYLVTEGYAHYGPKLYSEPMYME